MLDSASGGRLKRSGSCKVCRGACDCNSTVICLVSGGVFVFVLLSVGLVYIWSLCVCLHVCFCFVVGWFSVNLVHVCLFVLLSIGIHMVPVCLFVCVPVCLFVCFVYCFSMCLVCVFVCLFVFCCILV